MAKARAIMKRRKAVRNIKKITKTMQMIATAKFQKSLKRAVGSKPYTMKLREVVAELAGSIGNVSHPLLRQPEAGSTKRIAVLLLTSNRGLAGAYNGNVLRMGSRFIKEQQRRQVPLDLYVAGKKGVTFLKYQKVAITETLIVSDPPRYAEIEPLADKLMAQFSAGEIDAVYVVYMNFVSTGVQKPEVRPLLPLAGIKEMAEGLGQDLAEKEAQLKAGVMDAKRTGENVHAEVVTGVGETTYDFSPDPLELLNDVLPRAVKTAMFQAFLDASTSEHVARMVAMKAATDNADKMSKALAMEYNRARQSQITTELSEIMGGVEAMKG